MKTKSTAKKLSLAVVGLTAGLAMTVQAERYGETIVSTSAEGVRTATIVVGDLDLNSNPGLDTLTYRVQNAARMVCGPSDFKRAGSLNQARYNRNCATAAFDDAMSQVHGNSMAAVMVRAH